VHRRAANSAAGKLVTQFPDTVHDTIVSARVGGLSQLRNRADQKIAHLRIVLKARFA
jgi:hypothetical protein